MKNSEIIKKLSKYKYLTAIPDLQSKKTKDITSLVLTFLALIFFSIFAINPTLSTIAKLQKELEDSKFVDSQLQTKINNISLLQQQYATLKNELPLITDAVPSNPEPALLIAQIQSVASVNNINLISIQIFPIEIQSKNPNKLKTGSYSFNMTAEGTYENLTIFLSDLSIMRRIISLDQVTLTKKTISDNLLQITFKGTAYFEP